MRQLLSELSQTRRLAEDLISRLETNRRQPSDSPASTAGQLAFVCLFVCLLRTPTLMGRGVLFT
jgi:hypothetical protein